MNYDVLQHTLAFHCMLVVSMCQVLSKFVVIFKVQIFCEVIRQVFGRWNVSYSELPLSNAVADQMHSHVNSFRFLLFNRICGDANCSGVIAENDGRRLRVSDVFEEMVQRAACCPAAKRAAYSASPALATTQGMRLPRKR